MKRKLAFLLALLLLGLALSGCAARSPLPDLSSARSVEIRVYSQEDQSYTDYVVKNRETVQNICDFFAAQEYKKVKITEPMELCYQVRILYGTGTAIAEFELPAGHNVIGYDGSLYKIIGDAYANAYIADVIEGASGETEEGGAS